MISVIFLAYVCQRPVRKERKMAKYIVTKETAKKIVEAGIPKKLVETFERKKTVPGRRPVEKKGQEHLIRQISSTLVGPNATTTVSINNVDVSVKCPLLEPTQIIPVGTLVAIGKNQETEKWEIISSFAHGHLYGRTAQQIEGPSGTGGVTVNAGLISTTVVASCPLLHSQEVLDAQTPELLASSLGNY